MITEFVGAIKTVSELADGVLTRADRDKPDKQKQERVIKLQNFYATNTLDSDDFRVFIDELCNAAGSPLTPTGNPEVGRRELLHGLLLNTIDLIHERELANRAIYALERRT